MTAAPRRAAAVCWQNRVVAVADSRAQRVLLRRGFALEHVTLAWNVAGIVVLAFGDVVFVEDRLDRADRLAGAAVNAFVGVDVEHPLTFVDAVNRAFARRSPCPSRRCTAR